MGGDLNLKKSWHPSLMSNQKKVWEEEKRALDERKKIEQIRKEREEERQIQELQDLQEAAGGKKRQARVDWMYQGPSNGQTGTSEETEAFLLGKRRVDTLLQGKEKETLSKSAEQGAFMAVQNANTARDTAAKIRDDPLLAIKKQEQAAYEAMMNDPIKRRMLLKAAGKEDEPERERKRRKHHHHSSRHRDHERDRDRDSDKRSRHRSSRHNESRRERSDRRSRRSPSFSDSYSRSPSPEGRSSRRSPSVRNRRSASPRTRNRSRSRSPYRGSNPERRVHKSKSWYTGRRRSRSPSRSPARPREPSPARDDHRAARLAAMQQDATDLDAQRQQRLQEIAERESRTRERDERARAHNAKFAGGRADFVNSYHKRVGDLSLSERMGRQGPGRNEGDD